MKLQTPQNPNYAATVIKVNELVPLAGCDNLLGLPIFGLQAIVGIDTRIGDLGVLFPTECQLSDEYVASNSLYRHAELNADQEKKGYLEDSRRVKALKLRGHRSDALFMPLSSLEYIKGVELKEGDVFDTLLGKAIVRKFERPVNPMKAANFLPKRDQRVDQKFLPEQFDITHFLRVSDGLDPNTAVVITQKLHGANIRISNTYVTRKKSFVDKVASIFGVPVPDTEFAEVYGSHHVIKDANNPNHRHFYDFDIWSREGKRLSDRLPQGFIMYGELIGWANEKPIQQHYTYNLKPGECEVYIYRVVQMNPQGKGVDLSWKAVKEFCNGIGVKHVPELCNTYVKFVADPILRDMLNTKFTDLPEALRNELPVQLSSDSPCDEGVVVRIEGIQPQLYKVKADAFVAHETKVLDSEVVSIEEEEDGTADAAAE